MPISFGAGNQYKAKSTEDRGPLEPLPSKKPLKLKYRFIRTKEFQAGEGENLRLELRNADNPSQACFLGAGKAREMYPSEDGKTLDGDGQIAETSRAAQYFRDFQEETGLSDEKMSDLRNLEEFAVTLKVKQNPHPKAKQGSMVAEFISADPLNATTDETDQSSGGSAVHSAVAGNGEATNVDVLFTPLQLRGIQALQSCVMQSGTLSLEDRTAALVTLGSHTGTKNQVDQVRIARAALSEEVLTSGDGFTYDRDANEVRSLI